MKKHIRISILALFVSIFIVGTFTACDEESDLQLPYLFRPVNFNVELNKTEATFSWAAADSAVSYTLQVSLDSLNFDAPLLDTTITTLNYKQEFAGKTTYFARIKANAADTLKNSKFNQVKFKTPAENIFEGYTSSMSAWQAINIKWRPGANVTSLKLIAEDETTKTINITATNLASGEIEIAALSNSNYKVEIYNGTILRGTVKVLVEGDVYLEVGQDVTAAITNAADGQVIVLAPGVVFPTGSSTLRFSKNIKVRGVNPTVLPIICMTQGTASTTSSMLGFADGSTIGYVKFENIDFTGYCDNNISGTKIGYLFNNNLMTTVSNLSFNNCKMHNFGNTPMRLQANKGQVIDTLTFNKCTINEIGFSSTYAIVNSNSSDYINNIYFNNCTLYNFKGSLILRTIAAPAVATMGTVSINNCTINQGMQDAGSARYLIDTNNTAITSGITIKNSIFGSSGAALGANGVRKAALTTLTVTGSYYTTDYVDEPTVVVTSYSIKSMMTAYPSASIALWNDPVNGDFTLKATSFAGKGVAGDLRWY